MGRRIKENKGADGIDRRGFLECMTWAGTGMIWTVSGGVLSSKAFGQAPPHEMGGGGGFSFVQISDSHIGFSKEANADVTASLEEAIVKVNALEHSPDFVIHTGDLSHLSRPTEFDTLDQVLRSAKAGQTFFVPGEHDMLSDNGQQYLARYRKNTKGAGWYSFDHKGVHFVGLVNVVDLKAGGLGTIGAEQLSWLEQDLRGQSSSTPIVVFAHIPLWTVYPEWGWGTGDGMTALAYMKAIRFSDRVEWSYSPNDAEGGRECHLSHRNVDGISSAEARSGGLSGADESTCGTASRCAGNYSRKLFAGQAFACSC